MRLSIANPGSLLPISTESTITGRLAFTVPPLSGLLLMTSVWAAANDLAEASALELPALTSETAPRVNAGSS